MTIADLAVHEKVKAFHVDGSPAARCEAVSATVTPSSLDDVADRVLDELSNIAVRVAGTQQCFGPWRKRVP